MAETPKEVSITVNLNMDEFKQKLAEITQKYKTLLDAFIAFDNAVTAFSLELEREPDGDVTLLPK